MAVTRAPVLKTYTWQNLDTDEQLGPVEGIVSDYHVKTHAYAVDDYGDWYLKASPFGGRIGHPTLLANDILRLYMLKYDDVTPPRPGGLHAKNELEFYGPVLVGQHVTISGGHIEKYQRRGNDYRVLQGEVRDEAGKLLLRMRAVETVGLDSSKPVGKSQGQPADAVSGDIPAGTPVVTKASANVPVGAVLPALSKPTTLSQSVAFSAFPYAWTEGGADAPVMNIHVDPEDARRRGQPDVIVQGLCSAAFISEVCTGFFGPSWLTTGRLTTNFLKPVIVRDVITAQAMVKRLEKGADGKTTVHLDVWCKNQRGELTTVGRASAQVG